MVLRSLTLGAVLAIAGAAGSAQANQFVVNGDFTQLSNGVGQFDTETTVTGWSGNGGYNYVFHDANVGSDFALWTGTNGGVSGWNGLTASGVGNFAAMDGDYITQPISQTITGLTPGASYLLSFNYAFAQQQNFFGDTQQTLTVSFGGFSTTSPVDFLVSQGFDGWFTASGFVTADSTSDVLSFLAFGNLPVPPFALVSDVSLTGGVPEVSTWAMLLAGFAGLGFAAYGRSRKATAVA